MPINTSLIRLWCRDDGGGGDGPGSGLVRDTPLPHLVLCPPPAGPTLGKTCCASRRQAAFPEPPCWVRTHVKRTAQRPARALGGGETDGPVIGGWWSSWLGRTPFSWRCLRPKIPTDCPETAWEPRRACFRIDRHFQGILHKTWRPGIMLIVILHSVLSSEGMLQELGRFPNCPYGATAAAMAPHCATIVADGRADSAASAPCPDRRPSLAGWFVDQHWPASPNTDGFGGGCGALWEGGGGIRLLVSDQERCVV